MAFSSMSMSTCMLYLVGILEIGTLTQKSLQWRRSEDQMGGVLNDMYQYIYSAMQHDGRISLPNRLFPRLTEWEIEGLHAYTIDSLYAVSESFLVSKGTLFAYPPNSPQLTVHQPPSTPSVRNLPTEKRGQSESRLYYAAAMTMTAPHEPGFFKGPPVQHFDKVFPTCKT